MAANGAGNRSDLEEARMNFSDLKLSMTPIPLWCEREDTSRSTYERLVKERLLTPPLNFGRRKVRPDLEDSIVKEAWTRGCGKPEIQALVACLEELRPEPDGEVVLERARAFVGELLRRRDTTKAA